MSSRFSSSSEAFASELLENLEEIVSLLLIVKIVEHEETTQRLK